MSDFMRLHSAETALQEFRAVRGEEDTTETDLIDLIANLLHYASSEGLDSEAILRMANSNFTDEVDEEEG